MEKFKYIKSFSSHETAITTNYCICSKYYGAISGIQYSLIIMFNTFHQILYILSNSHYLHLLPLHYMKLCMNYFGLKFFRTREKCILRSRSKQMLNIQIKCNEKEINADRKEPTDLVTETKDVDIKCRQHAMLPFADTNYASA